MKSIFHNAAQISTNPSSLSSDNRNYFQGCHQTVSLTRKVVFFEQLSLFDTVGIPFFPQI